MVIVSSTTEVSHSKLAELRPGCSGYFLPYCLRCVAQPADDLTLVYVSAKMWLTVIHLVEEFQSVKQPGVCSALFGTTD